MVLPPNFPDAVWNSGYEFAITSFEIVLRFPVIRPQIISVRLALDQRCRASAFFGSVNGSTSALLEALSNLLLECLFLASN